MSGLSLDRGETDVERTARRRPSVRIAPGYDVVLDRISVYRYATGKLTILVEISGYLMIRVAKIFPSEKLTLSDQVIAEHIRSMVSEGGTDDWFPLVDRHGIREAQQRFRQSRLFIDTRINVNVFSEQIGSRKQDEVRAGPRCAERRSAKVAVDVLRIDLESIQFTLDALVVITVDPCLQSPNTVPEVGNHLGHLLGVRQLSAAKTVNRNTNVVEVYSRAREDTPVYERRRQVRQRTVAFGARQYQHLAADRGDRQATDTLFAQYRPSWPAGGMMKTAPFLRVDLAVGTDGKPSLDELGLCHTDTVVAKHEQSVAPVVVDLYPVGVRVVRVLEKLADRRRNPRYLLATEQVEGSGAGLEGRHLRQHLRVSQVSVDVVSDHLRHPHRHRVADLPGHRSETSRELEIKRKRLQ